VTAAPLTGFILDPTPESFTLLDDKGEKTVVARRDVRETREAQVSLMPEGLLDGLDKQSLTDFFSYLTAVGPNSTNGQAGAGPPPSSSTRR
jgi:hypothetical protein